MMEWLVGTVLKRAGILQENQRWLRFQYPNMLAVNGKFDFLAGGNPDWDNAEEAIKYLGLPEFFNRASQAILDHFAKTYPDGLEEVILEIKSCSAFMMELYEKRGANKNHELQLYHYLKATGMKEGHIVYISKDDLRMAEFHVGNPSKLEDDYKDDISKITDYYFHKTRPPIAKEIVYEDGKFSQNWKVGYSGYLTMLYGHKTQKEYEDKFKPLASNFNRVLKRRIEGKEMTKKNLDIILEIGKHFPNFDEIVEDAKSKNVVIPEEDENG